MLHSIVVVSSYMFRLPVVLLICILRVANSLTAIYIILTIGLIIHMIRVSNIKTAISRYYHVPAGGTTGSSLHGEDECRTVDDERGSWVLYPPLMSKDSRVPW